MLTSHDKDQGQHRRCGNMNFMIVRCKADIPAHDDICQCLQAAAATDDRRGLNIIPMIRVGLISWRYLLSVRNCRGLLLSFFTVVSGSLLDECVRWVRSRECSYSKLRRIEHSSYRTASCLRRVVLMWPIGSLEVFIDFLLPVFISDVEIVTS